MALVRACLAMLPRLQAEEALQASLQVSMGTGALERRAADRVQRTWQDAAHPDRQDPRRVVLASDEDFAGLGIKVVRVAKVSRGD